MGTLATFEELVTRYERGENAFDLTLEKWVRIRESLKGASTMSQFGEILQAAVIKVPFCQENEGNCAICPLQAICSRGREGSFGKFIGAIKVCYIAGEDIFPKSALLRLADQIISELVFCKNVSLKKLS